MSAERGFAEVAEEIAAELTLSLPVEMQRAGIEVVFDGRPLVASPCQTAAVADEVAGATLEDLRRLGLADARHPQVKHEQSAPTDMDLTGIEFECPEGCGEVMVGHEALLAHLFGPERKH